MIHLLDIQPCADYSDKFQVAGTFIKEIFSLNMLESLLKSINFKVIRLGEPSTLVCKRHDCLILVDSNGNFTLSEADSEQTVQTVLDQIKSGKTS